MLRLTHEIHSDYFRIGRTIGNNEQLRGPGNDINSASNRSAVIQALVDSTQMSEADATKTVDDWIASYKQLKAELEQRCP